MAQVGIASVTAAYRAAQEIAAVASAVTPPAVSVVRAHVRAVVAALPAWVVVAVAVAASAAVVVVVVAAAVVVAEAVVAGGNKS